MFWLLIFNPNYILQTQRGWTTSKKHSNIHIYTYIYIFIFIYMCVCVRACMCVFMWMYVYIYIYIHIHTYIHTQTQFTKDKEILPSVALVTLGSTYLITTILTFIAIIVSRTYKELWAKNMQASMTSRVFLIDKSCLSKAPWASFYSLGWILLPLGILLQKEPQGKTLPQF